MVASIERNSPRRSAAGSCQAKCSFKIYNFTVVKRMFWDFLNFPTENVECPLQKHSSLWPGFILKSYMSAFIRSVHHFNLGRRVPGFDYGPDVFGTGLTPLHLSDDGEGGAFHFQEPPPPYAAYKYPDIHHPDDPPPPYEASINPDSLLYVDLGRWL